MIGLVKRAHVYISFLLLPKLPYVTMYLDKKATEENVKSMLNKVVNKALNLKIGRCPSKCFQLVYIAYLKYLYTVIWKVPRCIQFMDTH